VGALAAAAGVGVLSLNDGRITTGRPSWLDLVTLSALVLLAIAAWAVADHHAAAAQGLALFAATLTATVFASLTTLPDRAQLLLFALCPLGVVAAGGVGLMWRIPRVRTLLLPAVFSASAFVVLVIGFNPLHELACPLACPDVPAVIESLLSSRSALAVAGGLCLAGVLTVVVSTAAHARGEMAPPAVLVGSLAAGASIAASLYLRVQGWDELLFDPSVALALPPAGGLALAGAVLADALASARARVTATRVAELIAGLNEEQVASSDVHFAVPGEGRWIDSEGVPAKAVGHHVVVSDRGSPVARVAADRQLDAVEEHLGSARRLALRNAQLTALARLRVRELQAARRQIVDTADAESRRIERDLHDGAQQRLVSSLLFLAVAKRADPDLPELTAAEKAVTSALEELRSLAHGIYPEVLRSEGVWAALDDVARAMPVPVRLDLSATVRPPEHIGHALFAATVSILAIGADPPCAERVELRATSDSAHIEIRVTLVDKLVTDDSLIDASDRVGALGGRLALAQSETDSFVSLELRCES